MNVKIDKLVYGGNGMGRLADGRAVFVPFCLPGEVVNVNIIQEKKNYIRTELVEILEPSDIRVEAKCGHFTKCAGCHYQHMEYVQQLKVKKEIFIEQLSRLADVDNPVVSEVIASSKEWGYRSYQHFFLDENQVLSYPNSQKSALFNVESCPILEDSINALWKSLDMTSADDIERIVIKTGSEEQNMILFEGENADIPDIVVDFPVSVTYLNTNGLFVISGDDHIYVNILEQRFRVTAPSFCYPNLLALEQLVRLVNEKALINDDTVFMNIYSGIGLFSYFITPKVKKCIALDPDPSVCLDFAINLDEFDNVNLYEGTIESILPYIEDVPEVLLLTPQSQGLDKIIIDRLNDWMPEQIIYVSVDAATFSRDAKKIIAKGYKLSESLLVDIYPQTFKITSINIFLKN